MASVIENYQSTSEKTPHQVAWWLNIESVQPGNNSTTNEFKSQKKLRETAPPVQQQQQQSDCCCCCCVTSKKWHHTHEANDRKMNPLEWFSTRKEKRGADLPCKRRTPPPFQPVTVGIGSRAHDTHVVIGWQNKRAIWKTLNLATSSLVWYLVFRTKFLSLAVQLIIGRQPIHTGVAAVATFSTYYAIGGFILSLSVQ
jgi:hypothetical protein